MRTRNIFKKFVSGVSALVLALGLVGGVSTLKKTFNEEVVAVEDTIEIETNREETVNKLQAEGLGVEEAESLLAKLEEKVKEGANIYAANNKLHEDLKEDGVYTKGQEEILADYLTLYKLDLVNKRKEEAKDEKFEINNYPKLKEVVEAYQKAISGGAKEAYVDGNLASQAAAKGGLQYALVDIDYNGKPELFFKFDGKLRAMYYLDKEGEIKTLPELAEDEYGWELTIREDYQVFATKKNGLYKGSWHLFDFNYPGDDLTPSLEWEYTQAEEGEHTEDEKYVFKEIGGEDVEYDLAAAKVAFGLEDENGEEIVKTIKVQDLNWVDVKVAVNLSSTVGVRTNNNTQAQPKKEEAKKEEAKKEEKKEEKAEETYPYGVPIENIGRVATNPTKSVNGPGLIEIDAVNNKAYIYYWNYWNNDGNHADVGLDEASVYDITLAYVPTKKIEVFKDHYGNTKTVYANTRVVLGAYNQGPIDSFAGEFYIYYNNDGGLSVAVPNYAGNVEPNQTHVMVEYRLNASSEVDIDSLRFDGDVEITQEQEDAARQEAYPYAYPIENIGSPSTFVPREGTINIPRRIEVNASGNSVAIYYGDGNVILGSPRTYYAGIDYVPAKQVEVCLSDGSTKMVNVSTRITLGEALDGGESDKLGHQFYIYYNNNGGVSMAIPNYAGNVPGGQFHVMLEYTLAN